MLQIRRTDLAMERLDMAKVSHGKGRGVSGISCHRETIHGIGVHSMTVETEDAAIALCKPIGSYYTISMDNVIKRCDDAFADTASCISDILRSMLPKANRFLIVCLGNRSITPDAVGPLASHFIMVTRHLKTVMPDDFAQFSDTAVICPGVLGTTGIESALLCQGAVNLVHPDVVIVIDALAACSGKRLCKTIQLCNTGIEPGSGVGNRRYALNRETLGVPVISIGIPTVVDAQTFVSDFIDEDVDLKGRGEGMFVTPREIDTMVADGAKLIAYGINLALHDGLTLEDIDLFVS